MDLAKIYKGRIKFVKIDARESGRLASEYEVRGVPAIFLIRSGKKIDEIRGKASKEEFSRWLESHL